MLRSDQSVLAQRMQSTRLPRTTTQAAIEEKAGAHGGDRVAAALAVARAEQSNRVQHSIALHGGSRTLQTWRRRQPALKTSKRLHGETHASGA
jgi:hypothetical protein